ncbi:MAG: hypothetical protein CM15mP84_10970 [Cellvibrionales bacterium]|nr:MAG: hypothetical protein CM15mP84_10970 [Cellvibrionales bacterium]
MTWWPARIVNSGSSTLGIIASMIGGSAGYLVSAVECGIQMISTLDHRDTGSMMCPSAGECGKILVTQITRDSCAEKQTLVGSF